MTKIDLRAAIRVVIVLLVWDFEAHAHDNGHPELNSWFESLKSGKGPCCSNADGTALSDADWEVRNGHYRVRIKGQWWDVPDDAVSRGRTALVARWSGLSTIGRSARRCRSTSVVSSPEP